MSHTPTRCRFCGHRPFEHAENGCTVSGCKCKTSDHKAFVAKQPKHRSPFVLADDDYQEAA
jgi:ribosomal protein L37E